MATTPAPSLGPKRAIKVFLGYFAAQIVTGIVIGIVVGTVLGVATIVTHQSGPEAIALAQRVAVMPAALLGMIVGGLVAFRMTRRSLPGAIRDGALRSIGWSPATPRDLLLAATVGAAIAILYLFGLVPASPPSSTQHWGPLTTAATSGLTLLGAATVIARIATGSLAPAVALHASYNLGLVIVLYATG